MQIDSQTLCLQHELLDTETRVLERLAVLRCPRNSVAPISQLPNEILIHIFFFLRLDTRHGRHEDWSRLTITHVCRLWREVALCCPHLWSEVTSVRCLDGIQELVYRAKDTELTIDIDETFPIIDGTVDALLPHIGHTATLKLDADGSRAFDIGSPRDSQWYHSLLTSKPAPVLQTLQLGYFRFPYKFPSDLFLGITPRLRSLSLNHCLVDFSSPLFQCELRHLTLLKIRTVDESDLMPGLLDTLRGLPCLHDLHLLLTQRWVLDDGSLDSHPASHATILLPRLKLLHLEAPITFCSTLVSHLVLPSDTRFKLQSGLHTTSFPMHWSHEVMANTAVAAATQFLRLYVGNLTGESRVASLLFKDGSRTRCIIPGVTLITSPVDSPSGHFDKESAPETPGSLEMRIICRSYPFGARIAHTFFRALGDMLPLHELRSCYLSTKFLPAETEWYPLIQQSKNVTALVVSDGLPDSFAGALATLAPTYPYPRLQYLKIENGTFIQNGQELPLGSALCAGLKGISRSLTLSLQSCKITEPHIESMKHHFALLEWDERGDDEENEDNVQYGWFVEDRM